MLSLGRYMKELRERSGSNQVDLAAEVGVSHSIVSYIEKNKSVRFDSIKKVFKAIKGTTAQDWENVKLLWLEQQTGETLNHGAYARNKATLGRIATKDQAEFMTGVEARLLRHSQVIRENNLAPVILAVLDEPQELIGLRQYHEFSQSLRPKPISSGGYELNDRSKRKPKH